MEPMPSMLAGWMAGPFFCLSLSFSVNCHTMHSQSTWIHNALPQMANTQAKGKYMINWPNEPWKFYFVCCFFRLLSRDAVLSGRTKVYINTQCCITLYGIHILFNYFHLHASHSSHACVCACVHVCERTTFPHLNWPFHLVYSLSRSLTHFVQSHLFISFVFFFSPNDVLLILRSFLIVHGANKISVSLCTYMNDFIAVLVRVCVLTRISFDSFYLIHLSSFGDVKVYHFLNIF